MSNYSIEDRVQALENRVAALENRVAALEANKGSGSSKGGQVADDKLFQGQWGNPEAFTDPKEWKGPSMKGTRFSECPVEWLDAAAEMYDRFGAKAEKEGRVSKTNGKPDAWRDFQKGALCRRWAQEKRKEGGKPAADPFADDPSQELPF